jgi:NAD(P)-dependent dehydrogenase (short-subunit alcohol dehydrogenase family)
MEERQMLLQDHIAVVTGGPSERGTAELMAAHGAAVAIVDSNEEALAATCAALGERVRGYVSDVTDWDQTCDCSARTALYFNLKSIS